MNLIRRVFPGVLVLLAATLACLATPAGAQAIRDEVVARTTAVCGDGSVGGGEACDDGDSDNADGCSSTCTIEVGFQCNGTPSVCTPICGDGMVLASEACDDGDTDNNDGCSSTCTIEPGFVCQGAPSVCSAFAVCGDGSLDSPEACDDGDAEDNDGCSSTCTVEPGFECVGTPSVCVATCGDGIKQLSEECDDGGVVDADGCSSTCGIDSGFVCTGAPSACEPGSYSPYDVDGNLQIDPLTDGVLLLRYFFGFEGSVLTTGAVGPNCARCVASRIEPFIEDRATP